MRYLLRKKKIVKRYLSRVFFQEESLALFKLEEIENSVELIKFLNFFMLDKKKITEISKLWNYFDIKPILPTNEQCTESLNDTMIRVCNILTSQGKMINSSLKKFMSELQRTLKPIPILPILISDGITNHGITRKGVKNIMKDNENDIIQELYGNNEG